MQPSWDSSNKHAWRVWWNGTPKDELLARLERPRIGTELSDEGAVFLALHEALRGTGSVSPNPLVGCVVVSQDGSYLGSGAHLQVGGAHAEIHALVGLSKEQLTGARVFVTLEPCAHHGRTPPCADHLAHLPIAEVSYLVLDPDQRTSGAGAARIKAAGIKTTLLSEWSDLGEEMAEVFLYGQRKKEVFTGIKVASTKSGIFAKPSSSRLWITGPRSRAYGHYLRMRYDSILVGSNTVLLDDPSLTVRHPRLVGRVPARFVLDLDGKTLMNPKMWTLLQEEPEKTVWLVGAGTVSRKAVEQIAPSQVVELPVKNKTKGFSWESIKQVVWHHGYRSLLIEGGSFVWKNALEAKAVQKLHWFVAPEREELQDGLRWNVPDEWRALQMANFRLEHDLYFERSLPLLGKE